MKKAMAELRAMEPNDQATEAGPTWLERIGEWFGDFLAEPSAVPDPPRRPGGPVCLRAGDGAGAGIALCGGESGSPDGAGWR